VGRMGPGSSEWPVFDDPLLGGVAAALLRRRKAIQYHARLSCEREFSETVEETFERLNVDLADLSGGQFRLSVWADGIMWLSVCITGKGRNSGWSFKDSFYGDIRDVSAATIVGMLEATLGLTFGADRLAERERLRQVWARVRPRLG
jgi:hypothetical protein